MPSAWTAAELAGGPPTVTIDPATAAALVATAAAVDVSVADADRSMFDDLPVADLLEALRSELDGPGLAVLRGFPVEALGDDKAALMFWGFGSLLGDPLPQNRFGDRLYLVRDETKIGYGGVRGSKTNTALVYHTDAASGFANSFPDTFGLLAVRAAASGGASLAISGHAVHERLAPAFVETLREPFLWDRSEEAVPGEDPIYRAPVFTGYGAGLRVRYNRAWIARGHRLAAEPLTDTQCAALDAFDEILDCAELRVRFVLTPGDALLVNNLVVLHNREAFEDAHDGPSRLLYRLWLQRTAS